MEKTGIVVTVGRGKLKSVEIRVGGCAVQSREKDQKVQNVNGKVSQESATSGSLSVSECSYRAERCRLLQARHR